MTKLYMVQTSYMNLGFGLGDDGEQAKEYLALSNGYDSISEFIDPLEMSISEVFTDNVGCLMAFIEGNLSMIDVSKIDWYNNILAQPLDGSHRLLIPREVVNVAILKLLAKRREIQDVIKQLKKDKVKSDLPNTDDIIMRISWIEEMGWQVNEEKPSDEVMGIDTYLMADKIRFNSYDCGSPLGLLAPLS